MLKNFDATGKGKHKKTKSDSNFKAHFRGFSVFEDINNGFPKHKKKPS